MATRPTLTLEAEAAIETARQKVFESAELQFQLLFFKLEMPGHSLAGLFSDRKIVPRQKMAATVKIQLRDYFYGLFDAEAQQFVRCQSSQAELHTWLEGLGKRILTEVEKLAKDDRHNFHCSLQERMEALQKASDDRIEHWIKIKPTLVLARIMERPETPEDPITPLRGGSHVWKPTRKAEPEELADETTIQTVTPKKTRHFREPNTSLLRNHDATLNRKNAAEALGVSPRQLDRYVADKDLTPVGGFGRRRFKTQDLLTFIAKRKRDKRDKPRQSET